MNKHPFPDPVTMNHNTKQTHEYVYARTDGDEAGEEEARVAEELQHGQGRADEVQVAVGGRRVLVPVCCGWICGGHVKQVYMHALLVHPSSPYTPVELGVEGLKLRVPPHAAAPAQRRLHLGPVRRQVLCTQGSSSG